MSKDGFKIVCDEIRSECLNLEHRVRMLTAQVAELECEQPQEVNANLMLAVRHLEDARMRIGKVIQWGVQDGVSKFDDRKGPA